MLNLTNLLFVLLSLFAGAILSVVLTRVPKLDESEIKKQFEKKLADYREQAQKVLSQTKLQTEERKNQTASEISQFESSLKKVEKVIEVKEGNLKKRQERNQELQKNIQREEELISELKKSNLQVDQRAIAGLVEKADVSRDEAKQIIISDLESDITSASETRAAKLLEQTKEDAQRIAKNIIIQAIHRFSASTSVEKRATSLKVPRDRVKGQLVGKDGEIITYLEELLEVDIIFNDLPDTIIVSGGEPMKRHMATATLEKLVKEQIINPAKIQAALEKTKKDTEAAMLSDGRSAAKIIGLKIAPPELLKIIGRLKFRTSYGQNILKHSLEVAAFGTILAAEMGADIEMSRFACFLHDIGKAIDYEVEGTHDALSRDILNEHHYSPAIVHAVYAHHEAVPCIKPEDYLVKAADAISAGRPGARQESIDRYLNRLHDLESIAMAEAGVQKSYAISAGRELRVIIDPEKLTDLDTENLAGKIAQTIEKKLTYPGKIKVNAIRKTVAIDYAR